MLCVISTFRNSDEAKKFVINHSALFRRNDVHWAVAISEVTDTSWLTFDRGGRLKWISRSDASYAEGWNNALDLALSAEWWPQVQRVAFLSDGDRVLRLKSDFAQSASNTILVGEVRRDGVLKRKKVPKKILKFASIRAWTPSVLFPADMLRSYRFPIDMKIANDIDIFFEGWNRHMNFAETCDFEVDMDSGGLSGNIMLSVHEYRVLYERRYGFSFLARLFERIKLVRNV